VQVTAALDRSQAIAARLAEVLGEAPTTLRRLSSGASRETFALETPSRGELVLQVERDPGRSAARPQQAPLLRAAAAVGVPVPGVVDAGEDDAALGASWILMEAVAGTSDPAAILSGEGAPPAPQLLDAIAAALAAVHRMPADEQLAPRGGDVLEDLRRTLDELGEPHPTFELALRALARERPRSAGEALVHGDFRVGNLMVGRDGVSGVLDWELAHIGDPVEDLGWLCVPAWRFGRQDRPAAGLGTREELLGAYERHGGAAVDPLALRWWELAGTLRWGVICVMQAFTHLSGRTRSIEHAVIGRRACEVEWDLLEMLGGADPGAAPPPAPPVPALHDRPTAIELLDAARATLAEDLLPLLDGRAAFELRVTMRALGMVRRELEHAGEHAALHASILAELGVGSEAELAGEIRAGRFEGHEQELTRALRATVAAKLQAANPRYLAAAAADTEKREAT
jgi:aminoglycoside phosphotransferase (APT) family kinase protein